MVWTHGKLLDFLPDKSGSMNKFQRERRTLEKAIDRLALVRCASFTAAQWQVESSGDL
jgi:hypothetical protein